MSSSLGLYLLRRVPLAIPTLLGVTIIIFLLVRMIPGDPARVIAGLPGHEEEVQRHPRRAGADRPIHVQYGIFLSHLLHGNLGQLGGDAARRSPRRSGRACARPSQLAISSIVVATAAGLTAGIVSATRQYSTLDFTVMTRGAVRRVDPGLLAWSHADAALLGPPALAARRGVWGAGAPGAADARAGRLLGGDHRADDPQQPAGGLGSGLRANRAGQRFGASRSSSSATR